MKSFLGQQNSFSVLSELPADDCPPPGEKKLEPVKDLVHRDNEISLKKILAKEEKLPPDNLRKLQVLRSSAYQLKTITLPELDKMIRPELLSIGFGDFIRFVVKEMKEVRNLLRVRVCNVICFFFLSLFPFLSISSIRSILKS
jgi:hypothetical protein